MTPRRRLLAPLGLALILASAAVVPAATQDAPPPLTLTSSRISIAGTSNIHAYSATTTSARLVQAKVTAAGNAFWSDVLSPGALEAFELAIPVATLRSGNDGLDKNMHKALKAVVHPEITFTFVRFVTGGAPGTLQAHGRLTVAGVERDLALEITTARNGDTLVVKGHVQLLMTDFGIAPPKAMLGMLKTDPKVTVTVEAVLASPLT
jgi:polyisoprenoid-binding protein YceI